MNQAGSERHAEHHSALREYLADHDAPCPSCGYNLRGAELPWCPECGRSIALSDVRAADTWWRWPRRPWPRYPVQRMTRGQWVLASVSVTGLVTGGAFLLRAGGLGEDLRSGGAFMMLFGFGLGLLCSQVRRGGLWYGGFRPEPQSGLGLVFGWGCVVIGLVGLATAIGS